MLRLAAALALCCAPFAGAQSLRFERLTQDQGLSQNFVRVFAQDNAGFIWIGSQDGLNRFDGYEVRVFRPDGSGAALHDAHVTALHTTPAGTLWVGTREGGLARWDPAGEGFDVLRADRAEEDETALPLDYVTAIADAAPATTTAAEPIWVGTLRGLSRLDPATGRFDRRVDGGAATPLGRLAVWQIHRGRGDELLVSLRDGGLLSWRQGQLVDHRPELAAAGASGRIVVEDDGEGGFWLGGSSGLFRRARDGSITRIEDPSAPPNVSALLRARDGTLWVGTRGAGLLRQPPGAQRFFASRFDPADPHSLPDDAVEGLFEDATGVLWVGTPVGVARHDPASQAFRVHRPEPQGRGPVDPYVWALEPDRAGNLWVGSDKGLAFWNREADTWQQWTADDPRGLVQGAVTALLVDREGQVWVGGSRGLARFEPRRGSVAKWTRSGADPDLPASRIFDLLETRSGEVLVGTALGLARWDPVKRGFERLREQKFSVFSMAEDRDGAVWLGTFHNGVYRYEPATRALGRHHDGQGKEVLEPNQISAVHVDAAGRLWIGTAQGLFRRDRDRAPLRRYRVRDGLPNEVVMGLAEADGGAIWLSTNAGLVRHDAERGGFRTWRTSDGLPSLEFNQMAATRLPDGQLAFGTPAGFVLFEPRALRPDPHPPRVALTGLELYNVPVPIGAAEGFALSRSIATLDTLALSHRERVVTLTFTGLHFAAPRDTRYAYRLRGWDDTWRETTAARRSATYTDLPAGDYHFEVKASNRDGLWSEPGTLRVHVDPPPWRTWWAYSLYALLSVAALVSFVSLRLRRLRLRQRELEELVGVRTAELQASRQEALEASRAKSTFLANMSHELRTPLNAVLGFAQVLDRSPRLAGDDRRHLGLIREAGTHLLELINDVLSLSKIEAGRLALEARAFSPRALLATVEALLRGRAEAAGLEFLLRVEGDLPATVVGDDVRLRQVLVNLLSNAVKFTARGRVALGVAWSAGRARFAVEDTGAGIAADELARLFEPFSQAEAGRQREDGTGLGLSITREIVRLMGGEIAVRSELGIGTRFEFEVDLPAGAAAGEAVPAAGRVVGLAAGQRRPRVLVADDVAANRELVATLLGGAGLEVVAAADGEEAVHLWEQTHPDLVVLDRRMPHLDGPAATRRIREREQQTGRGRTPVVALTASAFEHERDEILAHGADDFLTKPFAADRLFELLERHLGVTFERDAPAPEPESPQMLGRSDVARLTREEASSLHAALEAGALERATAVARAVADRDPALGAALQGEVRAMRVDRLLDLLESAGLEPPR